MTPERQTSVLRSFQPASESPRKRPVGRVPELKADRPDVVSQHMFRTALKRERRRTERSKETFVLLLLRLDEGMRNDRSTWSAAVEALAAAKRDSDLLGWVEPGEALGVILTEVTAFDGATECAIEGRFRRELAERLTDHALSGCSIRLHAPCEPRQPDCGPTAHDDLVPLEEVAPVASPLYTAAKRGLDVLGSLALLLLLSPIFLLIALAVKLGSRGPIFFRQVRVGQMMAPFTMLKFRTMYTGVDHALHQQYVTQFIKAGPQAAAAARDEGGQLFKMVGDPRVTPIGRVLRKTSLDELPQFWNVLRGHMSLVGPRPPLFYEVEQYQKWHRRRVLDAKPGITGLWQVNGRSRTTFDEMVRLDLRYARTPSLATDLKILLATPAAVLAGRGAC